MLGAVGQDRRLERLVAEARGLGGEREDRLHHRLVHRGALLGASACASACSVAAVAGVAAAVAVAAIVSVVVMPDSAWPGIVQYSL